MTRLFGSVVVSLACVLAAMVSLTCVTTDTRECPNGVVCPEGMFCAAAQLTCIRDKCGNGVVDPGEVCDDGNVLDGDGCAKDCTSNESCGNGIVDRNAAIPEVCDPGPDPTPEQNRACADDCQSNNVCGNGIINTEIGEVCDDGNNLSFDGCSNDCLSNETCGNGVPDTDDPDGDGPLLPLETCDDGNNVDGDGCQADCTRVSCTLDWYAVDPEVTISGNSYGGAPIAMRGDGTFVSAHEGNGDPGIDIRLRSWTPDGDLSWEVAHSFDAMRDRPYAMVADTAGDLYLAASINATTDSRANVVKLSGADGSVIWQYVRDGLSGVGHDRAATLAFDSDGRLIVGMEIGDDEAGPDVVVTAFDPSDGAELWTASWSGAPGTNGKSYDTIAGMAIEPGPADDVIYVLANRSAGPLWTEPVLLRFESPATEATLAVDIIPDADPDFDGGQDLVLTGSGELVALLNLEDEEVFRVMMVGLSKDTGELTWERPGTHYGLNIADYRAQIGGLVGMPDGGLALLGWANGLGVDYWQAFVLSLDSDLQVRCLGLLDITQHDDINGAVLPLDAAALDANRVYVGGLTFNGQYRTMVSAWDLP
jgi:cysteine-rich repeat protein